MTPRLAKALGPDDLAATDLLLPGGRRIHELVLGPFGIVVIGDVPPASVTRHVGSLWGGPRQPRPLDPRRGANGPRGARRRARQGRLATDDRDFVVRVYAAIISDDRSIERSPGCAVVSPSDLAARPEALPVQRGLTPERRERLVELIGGRAASR